MAESDAARRHYQKLVDTIDADLDARVDLEPWLDAACVLEAFDPDRLRPVGGAGTQRDVETLAQEALLERCQLLTDGPLAGLWQLTPLHRSAALERLWSRAGVAEALAANPDRPDTTLQQMFERVVAHDVDRQPLSREELVGLLGAHEWLDQFADIEPSRREVESALARLDQLAPLRRLVDDGFVGREPELAQIGAYVDLHRPPVPLFVHAPGGVGKSTLLAQYALTSSSRHPTCYIDLDRPTMSPTQPLTILVEAARQLAGLVAVDPAALAALVNEVSSAASRLESGRQYESSTAYGDEREQLISRFVDVFRDLLDASPVVVVVDTFEEAEVLGREVVRVLLDFVGLWSAAHGHLRFILSGRTLPPDFVTDLRSAFADELGSGADDGVDMIPMPLRPIDLGEFDLPTARLFLTRAVTAAGGTLTATEADELLGIVGRSPMCLRLAARLVQAEGIDELRRHRSEFLARLRSEKVQALLYGRILRQLHDDDVRKLALPGLIVRRITVDVIREVLAGPCGLTIGPDRDARALFDALAREAALVQIDSTDGSARHRSDVRRVMLVDLAGEIDEHVVRGIDEAAVAYYSRFDDAVSRAEEIYHRLRLHQDEQLLESRWLPAAASLLRDAVQELDPREQVWLANKVGVTVDESIRLGAGLQAWERQAERAARRLLQAGTPDLALSELEARPDRSGRSPLFVLHAETYRLLGRSEEALDVARKGVDSAVGAGAVDLAAELLLLIAAVHEGRADVRAASTAIREAAGVASTSGNRLLRLRVDIAELRIQRMASKREPQPRRVEEIGKRLDPSVLEQLAAQPVLLREVAAELTVVQPAVAARALQALGVELTDDEQAIAFGRYVRSLYSAEQSAPAAWTLVSASRAPEAEPDAVRAWVAAEGDELVRRLVGMIGAEGFGTTLRPLQDYFRAGVTASAVDLAVREVKRAETNIGRLRSTDYLSHGAIHKECDVVVNGGLASAVANVGAVCALAQTYRLRCIGGSGAGSVVAAMAASAEYARDSGGFQRLAAKPEEFSHRLPELLTPGRATKSAHALLIERRNSAGRIGPVFRALVSTRPAAFAVVTGLALVAAVVLGGLVTGQPIGFPVSVRFDVVTAVLWMTIAVGANVVSAVRSTVRGLQAQGFGISLHGSSPDDLTSGLDAQLSDLAGLDRTVLIGDLLECGVDLRLSTTDVARGRAVEFPYAHRTVMFDPVELRDYFPMRVIDELAARSEPVDESVQTGRDGGGSSDGALRWLPEPRDLPVIVGVRIALATPGLVSAIPLYVPTPLPRRVGDETARIRPHRSLFLTGAVTAAYPVTSFDSLWTQRPTFAVNVTTIDSATYESSELGATRSPEVRRMGGAVEFASALVIASQRWLDAENASVPGFRDRMIDVRTLPTESGLSLDPSTYLVLTERGRLAGTRLADDFDADVHRWTRFLVSMGAMQRALRDDGFGPELAEFVSSGARFSRFTKSDQWARDAADYVEQLHALAERAPDFDRNAPRPFQRLRVSPTPLGERSRAEDRSRP